MFYRRVISYSILLLISVLILSGSGIFPQGSLESKVIDQIARNENVAFTSLEIAAFDPIRFPLTGISLYQAKVINMDTGDIYSVVVDENGIYRELDDALKAERNAYEALYGNLNPALYELLKYLASDETVTVAIWLKGNDLAPLERQEIAFRTAVVDVGDTESQLSEARTPGALTSAEKKLIVSGRSMRNERRQYALIKPSNAKSFKPSNGRM